MVNTPYRGGWLGEQGVDTVSDASPTFKPLRVAG